MLKYFAVENFRSIKEENIVEFDAALSKDSSFVANPTIGIAGANASGKSTLLQALNFTLWFMQEPFVTCKDKPTKLHLIFSQEIQIDAVRKHVDFEYILRLTKKEVINEILLSYPYKRKRLIYQRTGDSIKQGSKISKLDSEIWSNLRENCSIVSFAAQFNSQTAATDCKSFLWESNLSNKGIVEYEFDSNVLGNLTKKQNFAKEKIITLFKIADLGIEDFRFINKRKIEFKIEKLIRYFFVTSSPNLEENEEDKNDKQAQFIFNYDEFSKAMSAIKDQLKLNRKGDDILLIKHNIDNKILDFDYSLESSGTLQFFIILNKVMLTLTSGGVLILDEIEIKLHQN